MSVCVVRSVCGYVTMSVCVCVCSGLCVVMWQCLSVCVCSGLCVVCVPVCDSVTLCHSDNLLLFAVSRWPVPYDSVYRLRPPGSRHQVLLFISSVTHKMRFVSSGVVDGQSASLQWCTCDIHCVPEKSSHLLTLCNFVKSWLIFKTFAMLESVWNLLQNTYDITHLTLCMLLQYLGKLKIQIFCRYSADMEENAKHRCCIEFHTLSGSAKILKIG